MALCEEQKQERIKQVTGLLKDLSGEEKSEVVAEALTAVQKPTPQEIKEKQAKRLISMGFHKVLGMTEEEFINAVPLPKEGKTNHILVISAKYLSPHASMQLIKVNGKKGKNYLSLDSLEDTKEAKIPQGMFYWRYDLRVQFNIAPINYFKWCLKNKRLPGVANESIYVAAQKSEEYKGRVLDCPGSRGAGGRVPYLGLDDGGPGLYWRYAGYANPCYGSFSFGE